MRGTKCLLTIPKFDCPYRLDGFNEFANGPSAIRSFSVVKVTSLFLLMIKYVSINNSPVFLNS